MTATAKKLYGSTLTTNAGAVLLTATANTTVVTGVMICNKSANATTITLNVDGSALYAGASINANETWVIPSLRQVLLPGATVTGNAGASGAIDLRISGVEIA